ncbi:MAG: hypothetical protein ABGY95_00320 [Rubritalea sp.]|uniref:hypothetical protein n=1 Tax=Rubritalea sp. TaxID=2109375 RepID=UPI003242335A
MKQFADQVNLLDEAGTLLPEANISAIPKCYTRTEDPAQKLLAVKHIKDFLVANESTIKASKIIFEFMGSLRPNIFDQAVEGFTSSVVEEIYYRYSEADHKTIKV